MQLIDVEVSGNETTKKGGKSMKKRLLALMLVSVFAVSFLFAGCGKDANDANKDVENNQTETGGQKDHTQSDKIEGDKTAENPAKARANAADTLVVGMTEAKGDFLPVYYSTTYDDYIVSLIFDGLITNDKEGNVVPRVAEDYEISNENKTYTFHLKKDITFSDGTPLTAKDVAFTYTALADPKYDGRYTSTVQEIVGYDEYNGEGKDADGVHIEGFDYQINELEGIKVIDEHTVSFTFKEAKVDNLYGFLDVYIMPEHIYGFEKGNAQVMRDKMNANEIIGSGRYTMVNFEPKQFVELTANPNWYGGDINIKNIVCKFTTPDTFMQELKTGSIDMQLQVPANNDNKAQIEDAKVLDINAYPDNGYGYLGFNLRDERLADQQVRQALVYGFNREAFIGLYYNGNASVCNTPISQVSWAYTEEINEYKYDPDKAMQMLDEAGWVVGSDGIREKDGKRLEFVWDTYLDSKYVETLIPMLKADWEKIGVKVEANLMDFNTLVEKVYTEREFDMYNMAWSLDIDPGSNYSTFHSDFDVPEGNNAVGLRDERIDNSLVTGAKEFDPEKRKEIYQEYAKLMNEVLPYMFISQNTRWDVSNNRVENLQISPYCNWTYYIESANIAK